MLSAVTIALTLKIRGLVHTAYCLILSINAFRYGADGNFMVRNKKKSRRSNSDVPRTVDMTGEGNELTVRGHIDLLRYLPVHHEMHRKLLDTFRKKPGNYEGKYNDDDENKAIITNLGNGYLSIYLKDDISQPELSEFLVSKGWIPLAVSSEGSKVHEKWTNMVTNTNKNLVDTHKPRIPRMPERYY